MDLVDHALDALLGRSQSQAGLARRWRVHSSEREAQEVELAFRDLADLCLVLVHCQLQLTHDFAQAMQRRFGVAPPAQAPIGEVRLAWGGPCARVKSYSNEADVCGTGSVKPIRQSVFG